MKISKMGRLLCLSILALFLTSCSGGSSAARSLSIEYTTLNYPESGYTGLTGIRQVGTSSNVYITGNYTPINGNSNGTLYVGPILGGGTYYIYNYPSESGATVFGTNIYGPDNDNNNSNYVRLVGTYTTVESGPYHAFGFLYDGPIPNDGTSWTQLFVPNSLLKDPQNDYIANTYPHSIMGSLVVGNYDESNSSGESSPTSGGNAFIYNIATESYIELVKPGFPQPLFTSAYGIWWNGGTSYTIVGGDSDVSSTSYTTGYIADYDSATESVSNWTEYTYPNATITHFEGITTDNNGGYNIAAGLEVESAAVASFVHVSRTSSGGFSSAQWINVAYPNASITTGDTVYQNYLLGVYKIPPSSLLNGYVATIPTSWY